VFLRGYVAPTLETRRPKSASRTCLWAKSPSMLFSVSAVHGIAGWYLSLSFPPSSLFLVFFLSLSSNNPYLSAGPTCSFFPVQLPRAFARFCGSSGKELFYSKSLVNGKHKPSFFSVSQPSPRGCSPLAYLFKAAVRCIYSGQGRDLLLLFWRWRSLL